MVDRNLQRLNVHPSELAEDEEFLRRVYLDLVGRLPSADEARNFLGDAGPMREKRARLVEDLLELPEYADYGIADELRFALRPAAAGILSGADRARHVGAVGLPATTEIEHSSTDEAGAPQVCAVDLAAVEVGPIQPCAADAGATHSAKVSAANALLRFGREAIELDDVVARVEALEQASDQTKADLRLA